eukprot:9427210-Pyramimonas_sp.AAC.1
MSSPRCWRTAKWWSAAVRHAYRSLRVQTTFFPNIGRPCLEDNKRGRLSTPKTSNKLARLVDELHFEYGPCSSNKPNISAPLQLVDPHGIPWNDGLPTIWTAVLSFVTRTSRA